MNKLPSKYKYRYWCTEKIKYTLFFEAFEEGVLIFQIPPYGNMYYYTSDLLNVAIDTIEADSPEEAMSMFEQMVNDYLDYQYSHYQEALEMFNELKDVVAYDENNEATFAVSDCSNINLRTI